MIGALLAILIMGFQWYYGLIPNNHGWQAMKSVGGPYLLLLIALIILSAIRAPVALDRQRRTNAINLAAENDYLQGTISEGREKAKRLNVEIEDLKKPKRTPLQEKEYQRIKGLMGDYDQDCIAVLRHLMRHGKMGKYQGGAIDNLPDGLDCKRTEIALKKLLENQVVTRETIPKGNMQWQQWSIAPGVNSALEELL